MKRTADSPNTHASDKTTTKNGTMSSAGSSSSRLNDDTDDEDCCAGNDRILAADDLSKEARVECGEPGTKFEDRSEPALLTAVLRKLSVYPLHICLKMTRRTEVHSPTT